MPSPKNDEEALFRAAIELPADKRPAFLEAMCAGDSALRARLEGLLAARDQSGHAPPAQTIKLDLTPPEDEAVGKFVGRYKILEKVGEGGCGVVYVAEQTQPVRRRVALKVIKLGMDTKAVVARFEAERQALAMMDHPNIAKVLDAGATEQGRPFFVMELVRGIRITEYCDQNNLTTTERIDLFVKVCHAIQHAHQKGIIHRDIKPSNILVTLHDGVPIPKVIDFGIAKATEGKLTDATVYTQLHQFIGTPAYMSPEQAEMSGLDIDTRSDIYSLGVLLYELLTGRTPFDAQELVAHGLDAMRKAIRENEPARPSGKVAALTNDERTTTAKRRSVDSPKLLHQLKGDLDWIVMKCLEKDRTRRYETANGLALDLKRHLDSEPVLARPPSALYRLQKVAQRNKLVFAAASAVVLALALGIVASRWQAVRATRAKEDALAEKARAAQSADVANRITQLLESMINSADPANGGKPGYTVRQMLEDFSGTLETNLPDDPLARAGVFESVGDVLWGMGDLQKGSNLLYHAVLERENPHLPESPEHANTLRNFGWILDGMGHEQEAMQRMNESAAIFRKLGQTGSPYIETLHGLETIYLHMRNMAGVEKMAAEAEAVAAKTPNVPLYGMADIYDNLVYAKLSQSNYASAEVVARKALAMHLKADGPDSPQTAWGWESLQVALGYARRHFREAMSADQRAYEIFRKDFPPEHAFIYFPLDHMERLLDDATNTAWASNSTSPDDNLTAAELASQRALWIAETKEWQTSFADKAGEAVDPVFLNSVAWSMATTSTAELRDGPVATRLAEIAVKKTMRTNDVILDTLAAAFAASGRFQEAVATEREALALSTTETNTLLYTTRVALYRTNAPFHY